MADARDSEKKSGLTRGKAILIAVLAVVLVAVIYIQFGSSGASASSPAVEYHPPGPPAIAKPASIPVAASPTSPAATPAVAVSVKTNSAADVRNVPIIDETHWKAPNVNSVVSYDPFALPASFPQP